MTHLQEACEDVKRRNLGEPSPKPRTWLSGLQEWWERVNAPVPKLEDSLERSFKKAEAKLVEARKLAEVKARHDAISQIAHRLMEEKVCGSLQNGMSLRDAPKLIESSGIQITLIYQTATAIYDATQRASEMAKIAEGAFVKSESRNTSKSDNT